MSVCAAACAILTSVVQTQQPCVRMTKFLHRGGKLPGYMVPLILLLLPVTSIAAAVFDVTKFGAKGDGVTYDTAAVRRAAAAMRAAGGGELLFPPGSRVLTAPFNLSSHAILTIADNATVLCSARGQDYPLVQVWLRLPVSPAESQPSQHYAAPGYFPQPCVYFDGGHEPGGGRNITIQGPGTLDGQGKGWWKCGLTGMLSPPCLTAPPYDPKVVSNASNTLVGGRPHLLIIHNATDVIMRNLKTRNTPSWNLQFDWVTNLHVHHVHSVNDPGGPNAGTHTRPPPSPNCHTSYSLHAAAA